MMLLKSFIFALTLCELVTDLDAYILCQKGQRVRVNYGRENCEICPDGYYQPEENDSQSCKACTKCEENRGSVVKQECTKTTDRKCQCRRDFVPMESDSSTCKCDIGFGITNNECSKCQHGYFSMGIDKPCQKWKECKSGVKMNGTSTSDVICNVYNTVPNTRVPSHHPPEETTTRNIYTTSTTTNTAPLGHTVTTKPPEIINTATPSSKTGSHIGMALLFGIVGLLVLTAVTCKLHITPCMGRNPAVPTEDSLCGTPTEESGDDSRSSGSPEVKLSLT